jgi:hypothetical protein
MNRNSFAAIAATLAVIVVVGLGFHFLGGPGTQRLVRADDARVRSLAMIAQQIQQAWHNSKGVLPANLDNLPEIPELAKKDALTGKPFPYRPKSGSQYELCATFATDNREGDTRDSSDQWIHPKGDYCLQLDAAKPVLNPPYYYR